MKKLVYFLFGISALVIFFGFNLSFPVVYAETDDINITFIFENKKFIYHSSNYESVNSFYFKSKLQNRFGFKDRAELLKDVLSLGIEPTKALSYCLIGIDGVLNDMKEQIECAPTDATYTFSDSYPHFTFTKEKVGLSLDFWLIANQIYDKLRFENNITIKLTPTRINPTVFYDDIKDYANLKSEFSTSIMPNENRQHNINLALSAFNKLVIEPDKEYSFNLITGQRSVSRGYKEAKIIVNGKYVDGTGGGVCQVSTTLYNALLLAGVDITEVHNHSLNSSYVKLGFDAMVNFGSADLKWRNNFDFPLFVLTNIVGNNIVVKIFGKNIHNVRYERVCEIEETSPPPDDEIVVDSDGEYADLVQYNDESEYIQLPHTGYTVRAFLVKFENGNLVERKLLRRVRYHSCGGIKVVGTKERNNFDLSSNSY